MPSTSSYEHVKRQMAAGRDPSLADMLAQIVALRTKVTMAAVEAECLSATMMRLADEANVLAARMEGAIR